MGGADCLAPRHVAVSCSVVVDPATVTVPEVRVRTTVERMVVGGGEMCEV